VKYLRDCLPWEELSYREREGLIGALDAWRDQINDTLYAKDE
jgi:hypothetical protein